MMPNESPTVKCHANVPTPPAPPTCGDRNLSDTTTSLESVDKQKALLIDTSTPASSPEASGAGDSPEVSSPSRSAMSPPSSIGEDDLAMSPFVSPRVLASATGVRSPPVQNVDDLIPSIDNLNKRRALKPRRRLDVNEESIRRQRLLAQVENSVNELPPLLKGVNERLSLQSLRYESWYTAAVTNISLRSPPVPGVADEGDIDTDRTKRRTKSPKTILEEASRLKSYLRKRHHSQETEHVRQRFARLAASFDPEATDDSDVSDDEGLIPTWRSQVPIPKHRQQWAFDKTQAHWRMQWLKEHLSSINTELEKINASPQKQSIHHRRDDGLCARSRAEPLPKRALLLDSTVNSIRTPLVPHSSASMEGLRRLAADVDDSFHPVLSFCSDLPASIFLEWRRFQVEYEKQQKLAAIKKYKNPAVVTTKFPLRTSHASSDIPKPSLGQLQISDSDSCPPGSSHLLGSLLVDLRSQLDLSRIPLPFWDRSGLDPAEHDSFQFKKAEVNSDESYQKRHAIFEKREHNRYIQALKQKQKKQKLRPFSNMGRTYSASEAYPKRTFPLSAEELSKLSDEVHAAPRQSYQVKQCPTSSEAQSIKLVLKLSKRV